MASPESSSQYRWVILAMLLLISMVTYLDRVNISIAGKYIMEDYGLDAVDMGKIFSAFVFGYALFQIPFGWMADKFGARRLLTFAILWWSAFTAVTAVAAEIFTAQLLGVFGSFLLIRFLIGAGEGDIDPIQNRPASIAGSSSPCCF